MKKYLKIIVIALTPLLIPLIAMQFSDEVQWTASDFVVAGILLVTSSVFITAALSFIKNKSLRWVVVLVILFLLLVVWLELAVGIFGSPFAGS